MHIAFLSAEYPPHVGGIGDYTRQLGAGLIERGHAVTVVTGTGKEENRGAGEDTLPEVVRVETDWRWGMWRRVEGVLREVRPDVVHVQYQTGAYGQHPAINLLPWYLRRRGFHAPIVVTLHDLLLPYLFPRADLVRHWVTRRLVRSASKVLVTNAEDAQRIAGTFAPDREHYNGDHVVAEVAPIGSNIAVAPPLGYDRVAWRQQFGLDGKRVVAFFGLLGASKGVLELLHALPELGEDVHLLLIGGGTTTSTEEAYRRQVEDVITERGLQMRVTQTGPCAASLVSAYLLSSDLAVLPFADGASFRRGSLLATLAHGLPVITTSPLVEQVPPLIDGEHARLVPNNAPATLALAIRQLLADAPLRERLARGGQALAGHFAWPAIARGHEVVYNNLITRN